MKKVTVTSRDMTIDEYRLFVQHLADIYIADRKKKEGIKSEQASSNKKYKSS